MDSSRATATARDARTTALQRASKSPLTNIRSIFTATKDNLAIKETAIVQPDKAQILSLIMD